MSSVTDMITMFSNLVFSTENYDALLINLADNKASVINVKLGVGLSTAVMMQRQQKTYSKVGPSLMVWMQPLLYLEKINFEVLKPLEDAYFLGLEQTILDFYNAGA